jgi:hypothetical protein
MAIIADTVGGRIPTLLPQRDKPYLVRGAFQRVVDGCRNESVLDLDDCYFMVRVNEDDDSLSFQFVETEFDPGSAYSSLSSVVPWDRFVGKECGWTWIGINQQGYTDSVMLSFAGIVPSVLLHGIASSIAFFSIVSVND